MGLKAYWAYEFVCDEPIEDMLVRLNSAGPWRWSPRDSHWYGDYLNARPVEGVRVRIHEWPESKYTALLQIESDSTAEQSAIDRIMQDLLGRLKARQVVETEPYD
ncbi:MAG: hypothetical protein IH820_10865 [Bacteroidetes bacterium]|nr:hypothetical protein [Bacteroidota bacterium]